MAVTWEGVGGGDSAAELYPHTRFCQICLSYGMCHPSTALLAELLLCHPRISKTWEVHTVLSVPSNMHPEAEFSCSYEVSVAWAQLMMRMCEILVDGLKSGENLACKVAIRNGWDRLKYSCLNLPLEPMFLMQREEKLISPHSHASAMDTF